MIHSVKGEKMQIVEYDIARCVETLDSPVMKDFVDNLDTVFALAESSDGFVWRCKTDDDGAESYLIDGDPLMVENLSVWASVSDLHNFLYRTHHVNIMKKGKDWFSPLSVTKVALWYVEDGYEPSIEEGRERLKHLQTHGDSDYVFGLQSRDFFKPENK